MKKIFAFSLIAILFSVNGFAQNKEIWGVADNGGERGVGFIFKMDADGKNPQHVFDFDYFRGANVKLPLCSDGNGKIYGVATGSSIYDNSARIIFEYNITSGTYKQVFFFADSSLTGTLESGLLKTKNGHFYGMASNNGILIYEFDPALKTVVYKAEIPSLYTSSASNLMQASNDNLYGLSDKGIFEYNLNTNELKFVYIFKDNEGGYASTLFAPVQASNGKLYGTANDGKFHSGILYEFDIDTKEYKKLYDFGDNDTGSYPVGSLVEGKDGNLYGVTSEGGQDPGSNGVFYQYNYNTNTYNFIKALGSAMTLTETDSPLCGLCKASDGKLYGLNSNGAGNHYGGIYSYDIDTKTFSDKIGFRGTPDTTGTSPCINLVEGSNGKLYGVNTDGSYSNSQGVFFEFNPATGAFAKKFDFSSSLSGHHSKQTLIQGVNGKLYGTTIKGGKYNQGVIFEIDPKTYKYTKKYDYTSEFANHFLSKANNNNLYTFDSYNQLLEYNIVTNTFKNYYWPYSTVNSFVDVGNKLYGIENAGSQLIEFDLTTHKASVKRNDIPIESSLSVAINNKIYGLTAPGLSNNSIMEYDPATNNYIQKSLPDDNGGPFPRPLSVFNPSLIKSKDGNLFGTGANGGIISAPGYTLIFRGGVFGYNLVTDSIINCPLLS